MRFIPNVERARYEAFVSAHPSKSHFMQSAAWGDFNAVQRGMTPYLVGLENDDGELCAAALLLLRKPPLFPPYIYSPRGFVVDFEDVELLGDFCRRVESFGRSLGAMFIKIDPDVEIHRLDSEGSPLPDAPDRSRVVEDLKALGFKHHGFNKEFEGRQPRFSFRIDLSGSDDDVRKRVTGNVMKNIRKGEKYYPAEIRRGDAAEIGELYRLITLTSERDNFFGYSAEYYRNFFETLEHSGMARLWLGTVDAGEVLGALEAQLRDTETALAGYKKEHHIREAQLTIERLHREIETFKQYAEKYPGKTVVSAHLVVRYGAHAWAVHAGSAGIMNETFVNNRVYWAKIMSEKADGAQWLDQFGTVGDPKNSHLGQLHAFKSQFGGRYVEFAGEFDLPLIPFWYRLYEEMLPKYRRLRLGMREKLRGLRSAG